MWTALSVCAHDYLGQKNLEIGSTNTPCTRERRVEAGQDPADALRYTLREECRKCATHRRFMLLATASIDLTGDLMANTALASVRFGTKYDLVCFIKLEFLWDVDMNQLPAVLSLLLYNASRLFSLQDASSTSTNLALSYIYLLAKLAFNVYVKIQSSSTNPRFPKFNLTPGRCHGEKSRQAAIGPNNSSPISNSRSIGHATRVASYPPSWLFCMLTSYTRR